MLLATLLMISATAEAGITVVPKNTQLSGDPQIDWSFSVYLTPGSKLAASTLSSIDSVTFTVENVIGLNWQNELPDIQISNVPLTHGLPDGVWLWDPQTFSYGTQQLEGTTVATTTAPFTFVVGFNSITVPTTGSPLGLLLGEFNLISQYSGPTSVPPSLQLSYTSSLNLNANGSEVTTTVDSPVVAGPGFVVVPEPSTLVIVALVGTSLMGVGLLRRWRRVA